MMDPITPAVPEAPAEGQAAPNTMAQQLDRDWRAELPPAVQQWEETKNAQTPDAFYDQMGNMRSLIGRSIQVPGPDAGAEARNKYIQKVIEKTPELLLRPDAENMGEFYNSLGRPESPDKYTPPEVEGVEFDQDSLSAFAPIAHEVGLSNAQYQKMAAAMQQNQVQAQQQAMQERDSGIANLKAEWGMAFDQHLTATQNYVSKVLPSVGDVSQLPAESIKELFNASKTIGSEGTPLTQESGANTAMTPAEAQEKIDEILGNPDHAYWNPAAPGNKIAVERVIKLHEFKRGVS